MAEVTGAAFLGLVKHVKEERDPDFLNRVIQDAGAVAGQIFVQRIITVAWYPYQAYIDFLKSLDRHMGRGDITFCRKLGEIAAGRDFETIYKMYDKKGEVESLIRDCGLIWKSYYRNAGRMEAFAWEPNNTIMRILDFPEMDPAHCRLMEGWINEGLRIVGAKITQEVTETKCAGKRAPYHEFFLKWTK